MTSPKLPPTDTGACGEPRGISRHRRRGERPCERCVKADNARRSTVRAGQRSRPPLKPCGTEAAYKRHRHHGEEACARCKRAHTDYVCGRTSADEPARPNLRIVPNPPEPTVHHVVPRITDQQATNALAAVRSGRRRGALANAGDTVEVLFALGIHPDSEEPRARFTPANAPIPHLMEAA